MGNPKKAADERESEEEPKARIRADSEIPGHIDERENFSSGDRGRTAGHRVETSAAMADRHAGVPRTEPRTAKWRYAT